MKHFTSRRAVLAAAVMTSGATSLLQTPQVVLAAPGAVTYKIDGARSTFTIAASESGIVNATRHVATHAISGVVGFAAGKPASVSVTAKAGTLACTDNLSAGDKSKIDNAVHNPILESGKYPNIVFKGTRIAVKTNPKGGPYSGRVLGNLTMHGVTRGVVIPVTGTISGSQLVAKGTLSVNQSDYKITPLSLMAGVISVKDSVTLTFNIVAHK